MSFLNFKIQWIDLWQVVIKFLVEKEETSKIFPTPTCGFVIQLLVVPANQSLILFSSFFTSTATIAARPRGVFLWLIFISYTGQRKFISVQVARKFHWKLFIDLFSLTLYSLILGTASDNIAAAIDAYKKGHPYRCDREGIVNIGVGKVTDNCCQEMKHRLRYDLFLFCFFFLMLINFFAAQLYRLRSKDQCISSVIYTCHSRNCYQR